MYILYKYIQYMFVCAYMNNVYGEKVPIVRYYFSNIFLYVYFELEIV